MHSIDSVTEARGLALFTAVLAGDVRESAPLLHFAEATTVVVERTGIRRAAAYVAALDLLHVEALHMDALRLNGRPVMRRG